MRILVEALCAEFGGIRTYAEHLLTAWEEAFPDDEMLVLVRSGSDLPIPQRFDRHEVHVPRIGPLGRPLAQTQAVTQLARRWNPDALIATLPSTTVRRPRVPTAVVVYDLRHVLRPGQFSRSARLLRSVSYSRGYSIADGLVSISQRTLDDLHRLHPRTRHTPAVVAHLGADHVDNWPDPSASGPAITFAHHTNKNLDLVLDAWRILKNERASAPPLKILGVASERRASLQRRVEDLGVGDIVELAPFIREDEFRRTFSAARLVVFPSDFEGFGLPIAEAMRLRTPVVIGLDPATQEVAGGHAAEMRNWSPEALATCIDRALTMHPAEIEAARTFATRYTWRNTAETTRGMLMQLVSGGGRIHQRKGNAR